MSIPLVPEPLAQRIRNQIRCLEEQPSLLQSHWCVPADHARLLYLLVCLSRPSAILEVGTSIGYSTLWLALGVAENGMGQIQTIEASLPRQSVALDHFARAGITTEIQSLRGDALIQMASLPDEAYDLVFLDARKDQYIQYLAHAERLLKGGGLLVADNTVSHREKMADFLSALAHAPQWEAAHLETPGGILLARKSPA
jgi:predicted O-methyltransferase YrrM